MHVLRQGGKSRNGKINAATTSSAISEDGSWECDLWGGKRWGQGDVVGQMVSCRLGHSWELNCIDLGKAFSLRGEISDI